MVVDLLLHGRRNLVNQLVDLERRSHIEADVIQQREQFAVSAFALVHAGVFNRDGDLARQQTEQPALILAEVIRFRTLDIEHPDDAILTDQRHSKLGSDIFHGLDVARVGSDVVYDDDSSFHRRGACNTIADLDAEVLDHVRRMADSESQVKLLFFVVDEEYREGIKRYDPICEFCNLLQQLVQIENRRDLVIDLDQCRYKWCRFRTDCCGIRLHSLLASSMILIPELVPSLDAPACNNCSASAYERMPPAALI